MSRRMRSYYYAVFGAMGGLIGWCLSNLLGLSFTPSLFLSEAIVGGLIGMCVGLLLGAAEGLVTLNLPHALRAGAPGALLGLIAGAVGLPLGEIFFQSIGTGLAGRAFGWALFGALLGLAEGIGGRSQVWKGALGGFAGGLVGGGLLEACRRWLADPTLGKAIGLILLGAAVGALIALIAVLLSRAWLEVVSGKLKGTEFILDKFMKRGGPSAALGSDSFKSEIALPDPDVAPQHALLIGDGRHFVIKDLSTNGTFVNSRRIELATLGDRQRIRVGNTELVYHERR